MGVPFHDKAQFTWVDRDSPGVYTGRLSLGEGGGGGVVVDGQEPAPRGAVEHWYSGEHVMAATVTPLTSGRHACTDPGTRPGDKDQGLDLEATQRSRTGPGHWATIGSS